MRGKSGFAVLIAALLVTACGDSGIESDVLRDLDLLEAAQLEPALEPLDLPQLVRGAEDVPDLDRERPRFLRRVADTLHRRLDAGRTDLDQVELEVLQQ